MKPLPTILLGIVVITFGGLVALGKVEAAAFVGLAGAIVHALLPAITEEEKHQ